MFHLIFFSKICELSMFLFGSSRDKYNLDSVYFGLFYPFLRLYIMVVNTGLKHCFHPNVVTCEYIYSDATKVIII